MWDGGGKREEQVGDGDGAGRMRANDVGKSVILGAVMLLLSYPPS